MNNKASKKIIIGFLMIMLVFNSCVNNKTHVHIPRTRLSMKIPEGYKMMTTNTGIKKDDNQGIIITDVVDGNYYTNAKDFTQHNLELQGMIVYEYKETSISGYPAKYIISSTDKDDFKAITVVFGDNTFSTMISSIYNAYDPEFEKSLIKILLSVKYDKNHIIHPFKNVNFMVDTTSTAFNHMRYSANTYDFSTGKVKANKSIESIIITPLFYNKAVSLEEISLMTINTNKQFGMYGFKEQHSSKFQNKGVDVLLKKGSCFVGTEKYYYHQLILAKNELMLLVRGMCAIEDTLTQQEISKFCELVELTE